MYRSISALYSVTLIYVSVLTSIPHYFDYCSLITETTNLFFFKIILASLGPLVFHKNFRVSLLISTESSLMEFCWNCFESVAQFENWHFIYFNSPDPLLWFLSPHLFRYSLPVLLFIYSLVLLENCHGGDLKFITTYSRPGTSISQCFRKCGMPCDLL